ncbi:MAG: hypothetical protein U9R36_05535 [Elusimicrobiota bacterium]|nr:hypothetical protein [Elusimicrobiota bacterium]
MDIALKLTGLFLGVFVRTWLPYIRKRNQGKIIKFDKKYLSQAINSAGLAVIAVLLIIPQYNIEPIPVIDVVSGLKVFATAFAFGFGSNTIVNELMKWRKE